MKNSRKMNSFLVVILLAAGAVADGLYLTFLHFRHAMGADTQSGICDALSSSGCEIALGEAGLFMGIPIAMIGLAGAIAILLLAAHAFFVDFRKGKEDSPAGNVVWLLALVSVLASLAMGLVSLSEGHFCPMCVIWYLLNIALWLAAQRGLGESFSSRMRAGVRASFGTYGVLGALVFVIVLGGLFLWYSHTVQQLEERRAAQLEELREKVKDEMSRMTELTIADYPDVPKKQNLPGQETVIRIIEFSDIECPFCRKLWENVDVFIEETEVPISVEFIHYPLNRDCNQRVQSLMHEDACNAAFASICAQEQKDFWGYTGAAFQQQKDLSREDLVDLARERGLNVDAFEVCLDSEETSEKLARDVQRAAVLKVKGTPTLFVNGMKMSGSLSPEIFHMIADEVLAARR